MAEPEVLAFDVYGTLVDPRGWKLLERYLPEQEAVRVSEVWRQKQLEYTFRLTAMEKYEDFEQVTRKALDYAVASTGKDIDDEKKRALIAEYNDNLEPFPDVEPGLKRLQDAGHETVVFSNGAPHMLRALIDRKNLGSYFKELISIDEVKAYKPSPKVYRHAAERVGRPIGEVRLVSSNPFDVVGAEAAGMRVAWVDRSAGLFDNLASRPEMVVQTLTDLAKVMEARRS